MLINPGGRIGRYLVGARLGEGATGVVYAAQVDGGGDVAVKVLRPELAGNTAARARFLREARVAAGFGSTHLVPVLETGEQDGTDYLVLPLYRGGSLRRHLDTAGTLTLGESIDLVAQLGRGLDALHRHGMLHRDVKPANVLLDGRVAALSDFGLALWGDATRLTGEGQLLGTAHYLAPELIAGEEASAGSDIYALGCVLYECLTGRPPFTGRTPAEVGFAHLTEPVPDPRRLRPQLPAEVSAVLVMALAKTPTERPTTATALARLLHHARTQRPA